MNRIALTDGSGEFFSLDTSEVFEERTEWDGSNHVSVIAGGKHEHERLYQTHKGTWILMHWSDWQNNRESVVKVDEDSAARWLVTCHHWDAVAEKYQQELEL